MWWKNLGSVSEKGPRIGIAGVCRNPNAALSAMRDVIKSFYTGKRLYLRKIVAVDDKSCPRYDFLA